MTTSFHPGALGTVASLMAAIGCDHGRVAHETTLSRINTVADAWDAGGPMPAPFRDGWDRDVVLTIESGPVHDALTIRSVGSDGLPNNSDDIVTTRRRTRVDETMAENVGREIGKAGVEATRGLLEGVREKFRADEPGG